MNTKDILLAARESTDPEYARMLWFLQSFALEDGGSSRFTREIKGLFPNLQFDSGDEDCIDVLRNALHEVVFNGGYLTPATKKLIEYMHHFSRAAVDGFYQTNIGRKVWDTLDWCLEERRPCFVEGREGRGKSASAHAWVEAHRGEARYVSLPGLGVQRDFFEALASAYGVNFSSAKAPNEIRFRIRDAIVRSKLVLIIDEAHHALPERHRRNRPPLIDFIDCDLCNAGVSVVLITTPQFGPRLAEFEDRTQWNAGQFRRRFSGKWCALPKKTSEADLAALAQSALPHVGAKGIKLAVGCAVAFDRDVSGMFDLIREAQHRARKAKRADVTYQDLWDAYQLDRVPSESAMAESFKRPVYARPDHSQAEPLPDAGESAADPLQRRSTSPAVTDFRRRTTSACEADLVS